VDEQEEEEFAEIDEGEIPGFEDEQPAATVPGVRKVGTRGNPRLGVQTEIDGVEAATRQTSAAASGKAKQPPSRVRKEPATQVVETVEYLCRHSIRRNSGTVMERREESLLRRQLMVDLQLRNT